MATDMGDPPRTDRGARLTLQLDARTLVVVLGGIAVAMAALSLLGHGLKDLTGTSAGLSLFDVDREASIPTLFNALLLLAAAGGFGLCARVDRPQRWPWAALAVVFLGLAVDESTEFHERLINRFRDVADDGIFHFAWVIPYSVGLVVFVIVAVPFLRRLPAATRNGLIVAGAVYVAGALGFEFIAGWWVDENGSDNGVFHTLAAVEELLEMVGATLALAVIVRHLARFGTRLGLDFTEG